MPMNLYHNSKQLHSFAQAYKHVAEVLDEIAYDLKGMPLRDAEAYIRYRFAAAEKALMAHGLISGTNPLFLNIYINDQTIRIDVPSLGVYHAVAGTPRLGND